MGKVQSFNEKNNLEVNEIKLENVTLKVSSFHDPVLSAVDYNLPTDAVLLIESSNPQAATLFLKLMAGREDATSGRVLWNDESVFTTDCQIDPRESMGCYFETFRAGQKETLKSILFKDLGADEYYFVLDYFDLTDKAETLLKALPYSFQKLAYLIKSAASSQEQAKQVLVLEDPASGLEESQWLCFLDYMQMQQRRGHLRHIFMTNHHPTAMRHIGHNTIYIEDGIIYIDENMNTKKASHF